MDALGHICTSKIHLSSSLLDWFAVLLCLTHNIICISLVHFIVSLTIPWSEVVRESYVPSLKWIYKVYSRKNSLFAICPHISWTQSYVVNQSIALKSIISILHCILRLIFNFADMSLMNNIAIVASMSPILFALAAAYSNDSWSDTSLSYI